MALALSLLILLVFAGNAATSCDLPGHFNARGFSEISKSYRQRGLGGYQYLLYDLGKFIENKKSLGREVDLCLIDLHDDLYQKYLEDHADVYPIDSYTNFEEFKKQVAREDKLDDLIKKIDAIYDYVGPRAEAWAKRVEKTQTIYRNIRDWFVGLTNWIQESACHWAYKTPCAPVPIPV
jgi:hypothetical protein